MAQQQQQQQEIRGTGQNGQTAQKPPEKSSPFSLPVLSMAVGGALLVMPWISGLGGSFLARLALSAFGGILLYVGFTKSR